MSKPEITRLGTMLRCFMAMERWSIRQLAPEIGISPATLHRVCSGYAMDSDTLMKILNWMAGPRSQPPLPDFTNDAAGDPK